MSEPVRTGPKPEYVVSACITVRNPGDALEGLARNTIDTLAAHYRYFELVIVDNHSLDNTQTVLPSLLKAIPAVRVVRLSRPAARDVALVAGLDHCIGDFVVSLDPVRDPADVIPDIVSSLVAGADVIVGRFDKYAGTALRSLLSRWSRRIAGYMLNIDIEPNTGSLLGFSRRAVNSLTRIRSKGRFVLYDTAAVGFRRSFFDYQQLPGAPANNDESWWYAAARRMQMIVAYSLLPLRIATALGFLACLLNLIYLLYIVAVVILKRDIAEGWLTTSVTHTTMFLLVFLILGILTEYVGRILEESRDLPLYFVEDELSSTVSTYDPDRVNVITDEMI